MRLLSCFFPGSGSSKDFDTVPSLTYDSSTAVVAVAACRSWTSLRNCTKRGMRRRRFGSDCGARWSRCQGLQRLAKRRLGIGWGTTRCRPRGPKDNLHRGRPHAGAVQTLHSSCLVAPLR